VVFAAASWNRIRTGADRPALHRAFGGFSPQGLIAAVAPNRFPRPGAGFLPRTRGTGAVEEPTSCANRQRAVGDRRGPFSAAARPVQGRVRARIKVGLPRQGLRLAWGSRTAPIATRTLPALDGLRPDCLANR